MDKLLKIFKEWGGTLQGYPLAFNVAGPVNKTAREIEGQDLLNRDTGSKIGA